jgi:hypothetical protein
VRTRQRLGLAGVVAIMGVTLLGAAAPIPRPGAGTGHLTLGATRPRAAVTATCWPAWERRDLQLAAALRLPVPTRMVTGNLGNLAVRLSRSNLPAWLGAPAGTPPTASALLRGFSVHGLSATSPHEVMEFVPGRTTANLVVEETHLTPFQRRATGLWHYQGAVTFMFNYLYESQQASSIAQGLHGLIAAVASSPSSMPIGLYTTAPAYPPPSHYLSYAGPLYPGQWLRASSTSHFACTASFLHVMGLRNGFIRPVPLYAALLANGIAFGFAPGAVVVANEHAGYDQVYWYRDPAIRVPPPPAPAV